MMRMNQQILTLAAVSLMLATPLSAQVFYGASNGMIQGQGPSDFYTIDPADGTATLVGPIGFTNVTGMACLPDGRLVASANGDNVVPPGPAAVLIEINPADGSGTLIGTIGDLNAGSCGRMPDITWCDATNTLYGYGDFCPGGLEGLFTINTMTGAGTSVGPTGYSGGGNGMANEPGTNILYATPFDIGSLITIDKTTGAGTDVPGSIGNVPFRVNALAFDPGGVLYGSWNDGVTSSLVTISTADGTTTTVGQTIDGLDALVYECGAAGGGNFDIEIPTLDGIGLALLALLVAASAWMVLRRRRVRDQV